MTIEEAIKIVKGRYGLLSSYLDTRTGRLMTVVRAEADLNAIPGLDQVAFTECGIALFKPEVIELAAGKVTIKDLVKRKNPELLAAAAELGSKGGKAVAERGPDYFRQLQARRTERKGGRPPKQEKDAI